MNLFFRFESEIPAGQGFALFSAGHILFLALTVFCAALSGFAYARAGEKRRRRAELVFGAVLLALELGYNAALIITGHMDVFTLPLHLCAVSVYLCVLGAFTRSRWIGQYMYYFGMPGALCALLFPDWTAYPIGNFYCIAAFLIHGMLVSGTYVLLRAGTLRPNGRGLAVSCAFVALLATGLWLFNRHFGTNYMFLMQPATGSPLEWIARLTGPRWYLPGFAGLVLIIEVLLYLPWRLAKQKSDREVES